MFVVVAYYPLPQIAVCGCELQLKPEVGCRGFYCWIIAGSIVGMQGKERAVRLKTTPGWPKNSRTDEKYRQDDQDSSCTDCKTAEQSRSKDKDKCTRTKTSVRSKGQVEADVVMMSVMPYYTNRTCTEGVRSGGRRVKNEECEGRDYDVNEAFVMV